MSPCQTLDLAIECTPMATGYNVLKTADHSPLLVHLVRDGPFSSSQLMADDHALSGCAGMSARERLINILTSTTLIGSPMPWVLGHPEAVCFTECVWQALVRHTDVYSCYGLVFKKTLIFKNGGGPALYIRGDILNRIRSRLPHYLGVFVAPFDPVGISSNGVRLDYLHEREWRLPGSLEFEYSDLEYVIVDSVSDANDVAMEVGEQHLSRSQIIPMESYRIISEAWGSS